MPKIKVKIYITTNKEETSYETTTILCDGILKYRETDDTLVIFDMEKRTLIRENKDLKMTYIFEKNKKTEGYIIVKEFNKKIYLFIETKQIKINEVNVFIEFEVEDNKFIYRIEEIK